MSTEDYCFGELISDGTHGTVFKALHSDSCDTVAIKHMHLYDPEKEYTVEMALNEIVALKTLKSHPNIVCMRDVIKQQKPVELYIVFEYVEYDLRKFMNQKPLTIEQSKSYAKQLLKALSYCHKNGILHADIKPENILVSASGDKIKLADFSICKKLVDGVCKTEDTIVTLWYRSLEAVANIGIYTGGVDIWATGCILIEMAEDHVLFRGACEIDQLYKIMRLFGNPTDDYPYIDTFKKHNHPCWEPKDLKKEFRYLDENGLDLIKQMFEYDPAKRITASKAISHKYLAF